MNRVFWLSMAVGLIATTLETRGQVPAVPQEQPVPNRWRGLHVINHSTDEDLAELRRQLPELARMGLNVLIVEVNYAFHYRSHPELRRGDRPITRQGAQRLAKACRANGIRLIPQFQCVGHQSWERQTFPLLQVHPEFDMTPGAFANNEGIYCREWDPLNPNINTIIFELWDELIAGFEADALHVGMDEIFLLGSEYSPTTRGKDPARILAQAIHQYHRHLVGRRGVEMLMWGDRLIDGQKIAYGEWESSENGTAPAVDQIPTDIIICDWHYDVRESYPSIPMFLEKGFRVLPAGWRKIEATEALIQYSIHIDHPRMLGHLFTTWSDRRRWSEYQPLARGLPLLLSGHPAGRAGATSSFVSPGSSRFGNFFR